MCVDIECPDIEAYLGVIQYLDTKSPDMGAVQILIHPVIETCLLMLRYLEVR